MSYTVDVKVITDKDSERFEQRCSELETELQDESVYQYYPDYKTDVIDIGNSVFIQFTAIFRIYYEEPEQLNAVGYGGAE